jgi:hypothetical protein
MKSPPNRALLPGGRALEAMHRAKLVDTVRSVEPFTIEMEYELQAPVTGLRVGIYLMSTRGEYIFTSFDTDEADRLNSWARARRALSQPLHHSGGFLERRPLCGRRKRQLVSRAALFSG